jgi:hypothetical protein
MNIQLDLQRIMFLLRKCGSQAFPDVAALLCKYVPYTPDNLQEYDMRLVATGAENNQVLFPSPYLYQPRVFDGLLWRRARSSDHDLPKLLVVCCTDGVPSIPTSPRRPQFLDSFLWYWYVDSQ